MNEQQLKNEIARLKHRTVELQKEGFAREAAVAEAKEALERTRGADRDIAALRREADGLRSQLAAADAYTAKLRAEQGAMQQAALDARDNAEEANRRAQRLSDELDKALADCREAMADADSIGKAALLDVERLQSQIAVEAGAARHARQEGAAAIAGLRDEIKHLRERLGDETRKTYRAQEKAQAAVLQAEIAGQELAKLKAQAAQSAQSHGEEVAHLRGDLTASRKEASQSERRASLAEGAAGRVGQELAQLKAHVAETAWRNGAAISTANADAQTAQNALAKAHADLKAMQARAERAEQKHASLLEDKRKNAPRNL